MLWDLTPAEQHAAELTRRARQLIVDLVAVRERHDLKKSDVADILGRHKSAVTRFEQQANDPQLSTILRYAHSIGAMVSFDVQTVEEWRAVEAVKSRRRIDIVWADRLSDIETDWPINATRRETVRQWSAVVRKVSICQSDESETLTTCNG